MTGWFRMKKQQIIATWAQTEVLESLTVKRQTRTSHPLRASFSFSRPLHTPAQSHTRSIAQLFPGWPASSSFPILSN